MESNIYKIIYGCPTTLNFTTKEAQKFMANTSC